MPRDLIILGAGGLARELAIYAEECGEKVVGFVCDNPEHPDEIPFEALATDPYKKCSFIIGVGNPYLRRQFRQRIKDINSIMSSCRPLIHPTSYVHKSTYLADGVVVAPNCSLTNNIILDSHVIVNLNCTIGHGTRVGAYSVINPGVNISGDVKIRDCILIGTGACIKEKLNIKGAVGMGAVVVKPVAVGTTVVGNPAAPLIKKDVTADGN